MIHKTDASRPAIVTLLAIGQVVGGVALIVNALVGNDGISQTLVEPGFFSEPVLVPALYGLLGIVAGIGIWFGRPWGWWLTAFACVYGIVHNLSAALTTVRLVAAGAEPARVIQVHDVRQWIQTLVAMGITAYWFSRGVLAHFGPPRTSRLKAILGLTGVALVLVVAGSLLPGGIDRDLERIVRAYAQGDVLTAIDELDQYLDSHPHSDQAWTILGRAHLDLDAYADAETAYTRALEINPERYQAWTGLGIVHRARGEYDDAMRCYESALEINPADPDAHSSMAVVALLSYEDTKALEHAERAYELDRYSAVIAANLALVYHYHGMYEQRDAMTAEAERLGYESMDILHMIYAGDLQLREE